MFTPIKLLKVQNTNLEMNYKQLIELSHLFDIFDEDIEEYNKIMEMIKNIVEIQSGIKSQIEYLEEHEHDGV